jgi:hypothetical protein
MIAVVGYGWQVAIPLAMASPAFVRADFITAVSPQVTSGQGDEYVYSYMVTNLLASTDAFASLNVNVDTGAGVTDITGPVGWLGFFFPTDGLVQWVSTGPATDILPGSVGLFSFISPLPPTSQNYLAIGVFDGGLEFATGTTPGPGLAPPAAVPAPSGIALLSTGLLLLFARQQIKRRPSAVS